MQPLFKPTPMNKKAEPEGGELPQNSAEWPMRVRDEWLKAAPWAWDYPTEIELSEVGKPGSGIGFGHIIVTSKTALAPGKAMGQMGTDFGVRTAKIPIIIEDFKLYPLDMIKTEDGAVLPLNEPRLGQALFRPTAYDIPGKSEASEVFGNPVYPPHREKGASFPMLESIAPTVHADQIEKMSEMMRKDAALRINVLSRPETRAFVESVANIDPIRPFNKIAAFNLVRPDVVKITRLDGGSYLLKQASSQTYMHDGQITVDRDTIVRNFGEPMAKEADTKGIVIIMRKRLGSGEPSMMGDSGPAKEMGSMGPCGVHGPGGPMMGWILPRILRLLTGDRMGSRLFTDGDKFGLQDSIGAEPADEKEVSPLRVGSTPSGMGVFCWDEEDGESTCTEPLRAKLTTGMNGRTTHVCETMDGREVNVVPSPMAESVAPGGEGVLIPKRARWIHIGDKMVKLPTVAEKQTEDAVKTAQHSCVISYRDGGFTFEGEPLRKIGTALRNLTPSDALFTCGLIGFSKESAEKVLGKAMKRTQVKVAGIQDVTPLREAARRSKVETIAKTAAVKDELALIDRLSDVGLRMMKSAAALGELPSAWDLGVEELIKQANSLGDPQSVDAMLSLGFLNIDNVSRFITYVPFLESVQKKLGVLLLASRLGLSELPQDHISRCFFALEQVIAGLRRLSGRLAPTASA